MLISGLDLRSLRRRVLFREFLIDIITKKKEIFSTVTRLATPQQGKRLAELIDVFCT